MRSNRSREHPNDETLLAYLDAELSNMGRCVKFATHFRFAGNVDAALAELESQAEAISHLLSAKSKYDIDRSVQSTGEILAMEDCILKAAEVFLQMPAASIDEECRGRCSCIERG